MLFLVDVPGWAYDHCAKQLAKMLGREFDFDIRYVRKSPNPKSNNYDLLYVFFWGETAYRKFGFAPDRIIKELSSHRWEDDCRYGPCTPQDLVHRYLRDAAAVFCTSLRLKHHIDPFHPWACHTPNGIDPERFKPLRVRTGPMQIGWAGNASDPVKGVKEILAAACEGRFTLKVAAGDLPHRRMNDFYNGVDVFAVTSSHEGGPLTLMEAMAAGCFPVCTDVGIVPEVIRSGQNGLIIEQRTPQAFRSAFQWCEAHLDEIRSAGAENARQMRNERAWSRTASQFKESLFAVLKTARRPKFRNDDVSWDTPLKRFQDFCQIFHRYNLIQIHGVTLRGRTASFFQNGQEATEYNSEASIASLDNQRIVELSQSYRFEDRGDLIAFLRQGPDEIALHGLYHTDYSRMTAKQQRCHIHQGLEILEKLFPRKPIRYFIPPFNRFNEATAQVCQEVGIYPLTTAGVHLEAEIDHLVLTADTWYRYHHHRFYPESRFRYYDLSLRALDAALDKALGRE